MPPTQLTRQVQHQSPPSNKHINSSRNSQTATHNHRGDKPQISHHEVLHYRHLRPRLRRRGRPQRPAQQPGSRAPRPQGTQCPPPQAPPQAETNTQSNPHRPAAPSTTPAAPSTSRRAARASDAPAAPASKQGRHPRGRIIAGSADYAGISVIWQVGWLFVLTGHCFFCLFFLSLSADSLP